MKKILLVEDEVAYVKLLTSQLSKQGYRVFVAIDGKKGLEMAKSEKPNLILLDIRMPVMDGMAMLSLLRKEETIKNTKVILLTNLEPEGNILEETLKDKPLYYFVKSDIDIDDLLAKIKEFLGE